MLVLVAVISIVMSMVVASVGDAKAKARDTKRRTDLNQIQVALELYRNEHGTFQVTGGGHMGNGQGWHQGLVRSTRALWVSSQSPESAKRECITQNVDS